MSAQFKSALICGTSLMVLLATQPAWAQQGAQSESGASPTVPSAGLEEIVVTAQRREERNQTVPIAITAFSNQKLQEQNVTTGQDLNGLVPSLQVGVAGQASRNVEAYTLRGQGQTAYGSAAVVVYLAEVPLPAGYSIGQQGGPGNYVDLENVQVLEGSQGTLFGRNTTGGAILLVPHKPTNNYEGYLQVSTGNYSYVGLEGAVNVPILPDKLLVRLSGSFQNRDGYTHDYVWNKDRDNLDYQAGRVGVTFRPTDGVENYLLAYGAYSHDNGVGYHNTGVVIPALEAAGACTAPCSVYRYQANLARQLGPRSVLDDVDEFNEVRTWGLINKTSIDLDDAFTLNNIVSYQRLRTNYATDEDGLPLQTAEFGGPLPTFPIPSLARFGIALNGFSNGVPFGPRDDIKQVTEELQLQGKLLDDHLTLTTGGFYYNSEPAGTQFSRGFFSCTAAQTGTCAATAQSYGVTNESKALYAQGTLDLGAFSSSLENLRLTGGFRYTWDTVTGNSSFYIPFAPNFIYCLTDGKSYSAASSCGYGAVLNSSAPTWTFGADYKLDPDVLIYAKVSRGYKAGGFNPFAVRPTTETFNPEVLTTYEVGLKSDWHLGSVPARLNVSAYSSDYSNIQVATGDANNGLVGAAILPAKATIRGVEAEWTIRPIAALEFGGNVSYTDAFYKQFSFIAQGPTQGCNGLVAGGQMVDSACLPYGVPEWIYNIHTSIDLPIPADWGTLNFYANYSHTSTNPQAPTQPGGIIEPFGLLNLSLNWRGILQSDFDLQLFATNATDELYRISNSNISGDGFVSTVYGEPQMYGLRLRYRFNGTPSEPEAAPAAYVPPPVQAPALAPRSYLVFFDFNKSDLSPQAVQIVDTAAKNAGPAHVTQLTVTGHTDTVGSDAYNMRLSRRRAEAVAAELEKQGVPSSEIGIVAKGKRDLLVPTADGVREPQNRRVQIVYDNGATS